MLASPIMGAVTVLTSNRIYWLVTQSRQWRGLRRTDASLDDNAVAALRRSRSVMWNR